MATGNTGTKNKLISLANVEFTENGLYIPQTTVTGFGKVKVAVPSDAMQKPLYLTPTATDDNSTPLWDKYSGPFTDEYVKTIGYVKQNNSVYDFDGNYIGRKLETGDIVDGTGASIGKASTSRLAYGNDNSIIGYVDAKNFAFDFEDNYIGKANSDGTIIDDEETVIGRMSQNEYIAYNNTEKEYVGAKNIEVRRIGSWIDSNISADNIRQGQTILGVSGEVVELIGEERTVNSSSSTQTITPSTGKNGITKVTVNPYVLQNRTVDPEFVSKTYSAESGYNGLGSLTVNPIDVEIIVTEEPNLKPDNIKKDVSLFGGQLVGTYDNYVAPVVEETVIAPLTTQQVITPNQGVDGFNKVTVNAVTSNIDSNITPGNIKKDVQILGVTGTYKLENLQDKTVDPKQYIQNVTFDSALGYEGLDTVTVNAVTSSIDTNITPTNIKKDVQILGVTGTYDPEPAIQDTVTVNPSTLEQIITPSAGYDGLGSVDVKAVTSSIDPNILAENIKKNISILGVTGTYESTPHYQESKTVSPSASGDIEVTPDSTYDALLKVIVRAVTSSIDPNILPTNIRKNVNILGVLGTLEEGGEQKWFDFSGIANFITLNQDAYSEGGNESISTTASGNNYVLERVINETFPSISNINAIMFNEVYGYDTESVTDDIVEECYINFVGGHLYESYSSITLIPDQKRYFYPFVNDYGVNGLTIGLSIDDGSARTMKLYVLTDSTKTYSPVPILSNGEMTVASIPTGYDGFRYIKDVSVPAHSVFIPKTESKEVSHWVLRDTDGVTTRLVTKTDEPNVPEVSAYDLNHNDTDLEDEFVNGYKLKNSSGLTLNSDTKIATQTVSGVKGQIIIPSSVQKQTGYYYYINFIPKAYSGTNTYHDLATCYGLFWLGLYRSSSDSYYMPAWITNWTSQTSGTWTYNSNSSYRMYTNNTYWFRVYVNGTTTTISWSSNGTSWSTIGTVTSSYITPTTTNQIEIYSSIGPNIDLNTEGTYISDGTNNIYEVIEPIYVKKTSHQIVPLDRKNLLVERDESRISPYYQGDESVSMSSFSSSTNILDLDVSGYIEIQNDFTTTGKPWEICQHFKLPAVTSSTNRHLSSWFANKSSDYRNCLWINTNNCICLRLYYNSSGDTIVDGRINSTALTVGTSYYIKYGWDGCFYYMYCSTNLLFSNIVSSWTTSSTNSTYSDGSKLILGNYTKTTTNGSIRNLYLDKYTDVRVSSNVVWKPNTELEGNVVDYTDDGSPATLDTYLATKDTYSFLNADTHGTPQISSSGLVSSMGASNFFTLPDLINSTSNIEMVYKIRVSNSSTVNGQLFNTGEYGLRLQVNNGNTLHFNSGNGQGSWASGVTASSALTNNVDYWVKAIKSGTTYTLSHSADNETWTSDGSFTYSPSSYDRPVRIGSWWSNGNQYSRFYVEDTYIRVDDKLWWQPKVNGITKESSNTSFYNAPLTSNSIVPFDKFNKQYVKSLNTFKPVSNTWEICCKYKFNSLSGCIFGNGFYGEEENYRIKVSVESSGAITVGLSSNGSSYDICNQTLSTTTLSVNTWYWFKLTFDGTQYKLQISTDNTSWTDIVTVTSSTPIYDVSDNIIFGSNSFSNAATDNVDGFLDLTQSYIKTNDTYLWQPAFRTVQSYDWIFTQDSSWTYTNLTNLGKKGTLVMPEHNVYQWDQSNFSWSGLRQFTFNLSDSNATLYTRLIEDGE